VRRREAIENVGWERGRRGRRGGDWHCNICRLEKVCSSTTVSSTATRHPVGDVLMLG